MPPDGDLVTNSSWETSCLGVRKVGLSGGGVLLEDGGSVTAGSAFLSQLF